jgi:hypothetical protein
MPTPTNKSRQNLGSLFARNAIPTEGDFADLIASCLNLTDDGVLKLPDQSLGLVRQRPASTAPANQRPVLSFFEEAGGQAAWEIQLQNSSGKSGFALADQTKNAKLFLDKNTGNLGIGTSDPQAKLHVGGSMRVDTELSIGTWPSGQAPSDLTNRGSLAIQSSAPQLDFIDTDSNARDWAIRVNDNTLSFVRSPGSTDLIINGTGNVGIGTTTPAQKLTVENNWPDAQATGSDLSKAGILAIRSDRPQLDFIDKDPNSIDWAIHVDGGKMNFIRSPWEKKDLVLDGTGKVGIGTETPIYNLHVDGTTGLGGQVELLTGSNPIRFASPCSLFTDSTADTNRAEISNDTVTYKCLMIVGNKSKGTKTVGIWDDLLVDRNLSVGGSLSVVGNLRTSSYLVRKVWAKSGSGLHHDCKSNDGSTIPNRSLEVTKLYGAETQIRITYYDNFQSAKGDAPCRWQILVARTSTPNVNIALTESIVMDRHHASGGSNSIASTIVGYAKGLTAGTYTFTVRVYKSPHPLGGTIEATTGWNSQTWTLEAEEVIMSNP